jgi:hypothetical protein
MRCEAASKDSCSARTSEEKIRENNMKKTGAKIHMVLEERTNNRRDGGYKIPLKVKGI